MIENSSFVLGSREFTEADTACINVPGNIGAQWMISPSALRQMKDELEQFINKTSSFNSPQLYFRYLFTREAQTVEQDGLPSGYSIELSGVNNGSLSKFDARALLSMLSSTNKTEVCRNRSCLFFHIKRNLVDDDYDQRIYA